jgi:hypothetical protein
MESSNGHATQCAHCIPKTNNHLLPECNFAEAVWDKVAQRHQVHQTLVSLPKRRCPGLVTASEPSGQQETTTNLCWHSSFLLVANLERAKQESF